MLNAVYVLLINPLVAWLLLWRRFREQDSWSSLAERLCIGTGPQQAKVWVHAASIGEISGVRRLVYRLTQQSSVLLTVHTKTAKRLAEDWQISGLTVRLSPLDALGANRRFLDKVAPTVFLSVEQEFWLTRFRCCVRRGIPVLGVSTRMGRANFVAKGCISVMQRCWPMDKNNAAKIANHVVTGDKIDRLYNPKVALPIPAHPPKHDPALRDWLDSDLPIILAASLHREDERPLFDALSELTKQKPDIRIIVAPRHPRRSDAIATQCKTHGLGFATRSRGEGVAVEDKVYIADTLGEMPLWYSLASVTIIGGCFADRGGHTPVEPVIYGSCPIYGPDMRNHLVAHDLFLAAGADLQIQNYAAIPQLLEKASWQKDFRETARRASSALEAYRAETLRVEDEILAEVEHHIRA